MMSNNWEHIDDNALSTEEANECLSEQTSDDNAEGEVSTQVDANSENECVELSSTREVKGSDGVVTFNAAGTSFQVSRETIMLHPDALLAKMISKQRDESDDEVASITAKPYFVDRSPTRFAYILDYYRDGKIILPVTESLDAMKEEMKYYGLPANPPAVCFGTYDTAMARKSVVLQDRRISRELHSTGINLKAESVALEAKSAAYYFAKRLHDERPPQSMTHTIVMKRVAEDEKNSKMLELSNMWKLAKTNLGAFEAGLEEIGKKYGFTIFCSMNEAVPVKMGRVSYSDGTNRHYAKINLSIDQ